MIVSHQRNDAKNQPIIRCLCPSNCWSKHPYLHTMTRWCLSMGRTIFKLNKFITLFSLPANAYIFLTDTITRGTSCRRVVFIISTHAHFGEHILGIGACAIHQHNSTNQSKNTYRLRISISIIHIHTLTALLTVHIVRIGNSWQPSLLQVENSFSWCFVLVECCSRFLPQKIFRFSSKISFIYLIYIYYIYIYSICVAALWIK